MTAESPSTSGYDLFLSHSSADKPWVRQLHDALSRHGMTSFLDEQDIRAPENYVLTLNDALRTSRFLVLVASPRAAISRWVEQEWTAFLAEHGPVGRIVVVLLEAVELPTLLKPVQQVDATHRDVERVATELILIAGRAGELKDGDVRALFLGQDLVFVLQQAADHLQVTDPTGQTRAVTPAWRVDNRFTVALLGFSQLTRQAVETDAERAELLGHARTLGKLLYELLFSSDESRRLLELALLPGQARPLVTIRSDDDVLLSLPWELLHDGQSFLVREARLDMVRSTPGRVGAGGVLREPEGYFKLVVNVSAPEGGTLDYEAESYRITRALSEHCEIQPTELGTLDDLVETVRRVKPVGVHFSGHGLPGKLQFENDEGRAHEVAAGEVIARMRTELPDGGLPKFFYLASCHGNEPAQPEEGQPGSESSAALLHRAGVPQVVGYFGPIADELSTRAEEALYAAIAEGETTRYGVRQARRALAEAFLGEGRQHRPGVDAEISTIPAMGARDVETASAAGSHPFSWAQLVFYQRGPDHALSLPVPPDARRRREQELRRTFAGTGARKMLSTGFIGRRVELHRIRRLLRRGDRVLVFQGLGGLGKTTLAFRTLPMLGEEKDVCTLWCQEVEREADPAEALVGQLLEYCRRRVGVEWEPVVQQVDREAGEDPALRFQFFLQVLSQSIKPLVVYLDNMESLLIGPEGAGPAIARSDGDGERGSLNESDGNGEVAFGGGNGQFATWRSDKLQRIWHVLVEMARSGDRMWVVASCRYRNQDFDTDTIPVSPFPADALYRLMGWFPALRRLAGPTRARLVERLAGHPRAVEFANDLVGDSLSRWEDHHGEWRLPDRVGSDDFEREWKQLVEPALPRVREKLWGNLLLAAIWDRVLDDRARRMLYRMTLLRRPWEWGLMARLGEANQPATEAEATADRLRQTSLLEQVELFVRTGKDGYATVRHYTMHPATVQFVVARFGADEKLRRETHRQIGEYLKERATASRYIETKLEAGHHLFEAGEYDRAHELLGPASTWLQDHGRAREGLRVLEPFLADAVMSKIAPARADRLLGTVGTAYYRLSQFEKAIRYFEQALVIDRENGDQRGEGVALGNLGLAYADLGQLKKAIEYHDQALVIDREIGNRRGEGANLGNLGGAYARLGQVEKAIGYYEQSRVIHREIGERQGESANLGSLGEAYAGLGQVEKAITYYEQALVISRKIDDRQGEGNALGSLGEAYARLGQVEKAIGYDERALVIDREIGDRRGEGTTLGNLGLAYARLGQVEKAIGYYEQALVISRKIDDRQGEGNTLGNLGSGCARLGQAEKAIGYHEQALVIDREIGDRRGEGNDLGNLGQAYALLGQVEKAIGLLEQALRIGQEIKDPQIERLASANLNRLRGRA